jgi:6-pyruvoyltetrahydropterin/6-carboxytetrahydropterin synthase
VHFEVTGALDAVGRVLDFSVMKSRLCQWIETHWDHRFLLWDRDPVADALREIDHTVVLVPFNPTAENMAEYLLYEMGPELLRGTQTRLVSCVVEETRKCSAGATL